MIFYIGDTHFGQESIIASDGRPFKDAHEMEDTMVHNWNSVVGDDDSVYILGDFCWSRHIKDWSNLLHKLKGHKLLLLGNLDLTVVDHMEEHFLPDLDWVGSYLEIQDGDKRVILCHYPIPFYRYDYSSSFVMLHGHVHEREQDTMLEIVKDHLRDDSDHSWGHGKGLIYNTGCMKPYMNYTPRTLKEIMEGYQNWLESRE